eukprot:gene7773-9118_t
MAWRESAFYEDSDRQWSYSLMLVCRSWHTLIVTRLNDTLCLNYHVYYTTVPDNEPSPLSQVIERSNNNTWSMFKCPLRSLIIKAEPDNYPEDYSKVVHKPRNTQSWPLLDGLARFSGSMDYLYPIISKAQTHLNLKKLSLYDAYDDSEMFEDMASRLGQSITHLDLVLYYDLDDDFEEDYDHLDRFIFNSAFINVTKLRIIDQDQGNHDTHITSLIILHPTLYQKLKEKLALRSFTLFLAPITEHIEYFSGGSEYLESLHDFIVNHKTLRTFRYLGGECKLQNSTLQYLLQSEECAISKMSLAFSEKIHIVTRRLEQLTIRTTDFQPLTRDSRLRDLMPFYSSLNHVAHIRVYNEISSQSHILDLRLIGLAISAKSITIDLDLSMTSSVDRMRVSWYTTGNSTGAVRYASKPFSTNDPFGDVLVVMSTSVSYGQYGGWVGTVNTAVMTELSVQSTYYYQVGDINANIWSPLYHFTTGANQLGAITPFNVSFFGDMGGGDYMKTVDALVDALPTFDFAVHIGDIAYANVNGEAAGNQTVWNGFMESITPFSANIPYMTCPGNHDAFYNFTAYTTSFIMPTTSPSHKWYAFDYNGVHFVSFSTEGDYQVGSEQYEWFIEELSNFRQGNPDVYEKEPMGSYANPKATVNIAVGTGGNAEGLDYFWDPLKPKWSSFRHTELGYGVLHVHNSSHINWKFIEDKGTIIRDDIWFTKGTFSS